MLIPSAPGAPLLDLTFFHASVILALDTMYSTDAKSKGDGSVTRQASKSPIGSVRIRREQPVETTHVTSGFEHKGSDQAFKS